MVRITIEIMPQGSRENRKVLGHVDIINDGTGTQTIGNYSITAVSKNGKVFRKCRVEGYRRKADSIWKLMKLVFDTIVDYKGKI